MYAAHALWSPDRGLCLWAEDADRPVKSTSQALRSARPHPFAVPAGELSVVLGREGADGVSHDELIILLPSRRSAPLDSPDLLRVRSRRPGNAPPVLAPWSVPVLCLSPSAALAFLDSEAGPDVRSGASLRHLSDVAGLARDLAARGRVLPTLRGLEGAGGGRIRLEGRWRPVLQGPDAAAARSLVAALPPVGRAEAASVGDRTGRSPTDLVTACLHDLVDAAARDRLAAVGAGVADALPRRRGRPPRRVPIVETWLSALSGQGGTFEADADDAADLREALGSWEEFGREGVGPARLVVRLTDPEDGPETVVGDVREAGPGATWRLDFLLQSVADPSLVVPAQQVWDAGAGLQRWLDRPQELLLGELGRASTVYPALADALRGARPSGMHLGVDSTYEFLAHGAALLDQAGFVVQFPSWWTRRRRLGLRGSATPAQEGGVTEGMFTRESLCAFSWQLAIGDDPLSEDELSALAAAKVPLVRMRGQWVAVDPDQVRRGLEFLRRQDDDPGRLTAGEVLALAARHPDDLDTPLPVTGVEADGWLGELLAGTSERALTPIDPPANLEARLRPYQQRGMSWLAFLSELGLGACLADDMGLGKTIQLLTLELVHRARHPGSGPTLLVCPMSLIGNWQREAARFAPTLRVSAHHGADRLRGADLEAHLADVDILVTTYQTVMRDEGLADRTWERVVLDEAQAIKNHRSRTARAVRRLPGRHRVALTGTPVENRLAELWSVMDFLNPGLLGSAEAFRARYARPIEQHGQTEVADRLRAVTRPYILRRVKTDRSIIDDLPDKIEVLHDCYLTAEQASLYQAVVDDMMDKIEGSEGIERRGNVLAAMTKLKQVCNHPAQLLHDGTALGTRSGKVNRLEEILEELLAEDDKALLFTQYTAFAELLRPHLSARFGRDVLYLHGGTSKARRDEMVQAFQSEDGPPLFLLSLKAGGTGLNLTAANHVIHLDRWWNPAVENQATDRAFRIGQHRNVQVRKFRCVGTLEERIEDMMQQKKALADLVVGDGEGWLTELSTEQLRELFTLSGEAFGG